MITLQQITLQQKSAATLILTTDPDTDPDQVAMLREMLAQAARDAANAALANASLASLAAANADAAAANAAQDPKLRVAEALKRVQDLLKGNAIQFDGAGAKATQTSPIGVPQAG